MDENKEFEFVELSSGDSSEAIAEDTADSSPFTNTPWNSDEEIYTYAAHKKNNLGWEWADIKNSLVNQGLDPDYAEAIIQNLIEVSDNSDSESEGSPSYVKGMIGGIITALIIGYLGAKLSIAMGGVRFILFWIAAVIIGSAVKYFSKKRDFLTGIIAGVCGAISVALAVHVVEINGFSWEDGRMLSDSLWLYMGVAALISGFTGAVERSRKE